MLKDYSEKLGLEKNLVLGYGSRNAVKVEEEILKECNSIKKCIKLRSPQKATELVINADNASHDIGCCITGIAARRVAIDIYDEFVNFGDIDFIKGMVNFCKRRITEEYAMIDIAQAAYNTYAGDYEVAEILTGQAKNKAQEIGLKAERELKEIINTGYFSETSLAKDVARDFGDYWNEYDELIKGVRALKSISEQIKPPNGFESEIEKKRREKKTSEQDFLSKKAIETAKKLFTYTSALNYVIASAKSEQLKQKNI